MNNVLITGNSGYIGSHLSSMLSKNENLCVHGLDKNQSQYSLKKQYLQNIIQDSNWNIDLEYDCVFHLAAEVSVSHSVKDPTLYYLTNTLGTLNVLKNIKTKKIIIASTGAAALMNNPYGISKKAMEEIVTQYCEQNSIPYTIFRFYNVIGSDGFEPTNPDGLFANLINAKRTGNFKIFGSDYNTKDGTCIRDYVHVNEICSALYKAIERPANGIENLGHGVGWSVKEITEIFKKVNHCNFNVEFADRRDGDIEVSVLSNPSRYMEKLYNIEELLRVKL